MQIEGKTTRIQLLDFTTPAMRAFHMSWTAFFFCFFAWFGIAPLMQVVRDELQLTRSQIGWCIIGSVAITVVSRLVIGWLCDRLGPRRTYCGLLLLGSLPVMGIALANSYVTFLLCRVLIGAIGASFVITQHHTSLMFASNCVGTANATTAGWGNLGGGVAQLVMPLLFALFVSGLGLSASLSWRLAMVVAGLVCIAMALAYYLLTQDTPLGDFRDLRLQGKIPNPEPTRGAWLSVLQDARVLALFVAYGACFGVELTINNVAALYFFDYFAELQALDPLTGMKWAGLIAGLFGLMNLFARTLGGYAADVFGSRWGLSGRVKWLFLVLLGEGIFLMLFSQAGTLVMAIPALILFSLFVQMSEGATFAVTPFVNRRALGIVSGVVGAGGNAGAVAAGFLFKSEVIGWPTAFFVLGAAVCASSFLTLAITFSPEAESEARRETDLAHSQRLRELAPAMP
jgi:MFS transporter, NNP family, nitrate/nitrite transporter